MSGVHRNEFTEAMKKDAYNYFWESYPEVPPVYESIFEVVQSNVAYEKFSTAIGLGRLLEKPEGEDLQADKPLESYTIVCKNSTYGRLVRFSYETVEDAQKVSNIVMDTVRTWARQVVNTKEDWYADFFNQGALSAGHARFSNSITGVIDDPSGDLIYDNKPFFDTEHPDKVGNTYSNFSASNTLTHSNLKTIWNTYTITNNRDERGEIIGLMPNILLIHPALMFTAREILNSSLIPGSMDNDINVLANIVQPMAWQYIDGSDDWFLGNLKNGLMATDRQDVALDFWQDETSRDYFARIVTRWGGCITNWRHWYGNNLPTT